ncbi:MAG: hypothetical protein U0610_30430 [bacterium]
MAPFPRAEPILDDEAVAERIAYLVCNPIESFATSALPSTIPRS